MTSYAYDGAGHVTSVTDPRGNLTQYHYDARNRVTAITYNDGTQEMTRRSPMPVAAGQRIYVRVNVTTR